MKWYWILLIVLAAVAVGMIVAKMIKPKASSPAAAPSTPVTSTTSGPRTIPAGTTVVAPTTEVTTETAGTEKLIVARKVA